MDVKLHILSELSESLLEEVPQSMFKVNRRLPHIHALLTKYMSQKSHLLASSEQKAKELLIGTSYNPSNIDAMLSKISADIHLYEELSEDLSLQSLQGYLSKFNKLVLQSSIDTLTHHSIFASKNRQQEKIASEWEAIKTKVVNSRGIDYFTVPSPKRQKNAIESAPSQITEYHKIVTKYFNAKIECKAYNMINDFIYVEQSRRELDRESLELVWKLLNAQVESIDPRDSDIAEVIIQNTCEFYEKIFIEKVIECTQEEGLKKKMIAYATNTAKRLSSYKPETDSNGQPVWAIIFTFLRGGLKHEIFEFCKNNSACREVNRYLAEYFNNDCLSESSLEEVLEVLNSGESIDVFKRAIFVIISKHNQEIDDLQDVSLEDYLWFKLKIVRSCDEATAEHLEYTHNNYSLLLLNDLQRYIIDCGPEHFDNSIALYVSALISCLCYGEAVTHLYKMPEYITESLHLSIVLREHLLLPIFSNSDLLFDDIEGITHVNYNKLLSDFLKSFSTVLPNVALVYISFMSTSQSIICECSNLVIAYENYQIVLNNEVYIFNNSFRKVIGETNFKLSVETIAEYALSVRSKEASFLFDLIESYSSVLKTWIFEIKTEIEKQAEVWKEEYSRMWNVKEERGQCEKINYALKNYPKLYEKFRRNSIFERYPDLNQSLVHLNAFLNFYQALNLKQFKHALNIISTTQLFPIRPLTRYNELVARIKPLSVEVKEEIPRVLFNALETHQLLCRISAPLENSELVGDMRNLIEYFGEIQHNLKGIQSIEEKFKMYSASIREILSNILIN